MNLANVNVMFIFNILKQDCFILDTGTSGIYVWIGKKGTANEKSAAIKNAENFIKQNKYPSWTLVRNVVLQGTM